MVSYLIKRPIAVSMCLIAIIVVGLLSFKQLPVSLMPDIDVPQITVYVSREGVSAQEVEASVVTPLREQLMQVAGLKEIHTEARMDAGIIHMTFDYRSNIDLLFIEVNEKVDRAMHQMPSDMQRPRVMRNSALDIPAFYLDVALKSETRDGRPREAGLGFAQLSRFAEEVVVKRLEQLEQVAMVDVSGALGTEIVCTPDEQKMLSLGMTSADLEQAIAASDVTLEVLSVVDGAYRYSIHFDAQLFTKEDVANIRINREGRIILFSDLCEVVEQPARRYGNVRNGAANAVTMAIIKQSDAQMAVLQRAVHQLLDELSNEYPDIEFALTRDQTQLLSYSISNLKSNLYLGTLLACLLVILFMRDWRPTMLIIATIPISLIVTMLAFRLFGISINVISLSGLILGVGMMVDNSIVVIDDIRRRWTEGERLAVAASNSIGKVFTPMLSSVLTTCSVFLPLIFLSGVAGALFYDQAIAITIALFASLAVAVLVIPVYFYALYSKSPVRLLQKSRQLNERQRSGLLFTVYERIIAWMLHHSWVSLTICLVCLPLLYLFFCIVDKQRMPDVAATDQIILINWNSGINADENDNRTTQLVASLAPWTLNSTTMAGNQDFLLRHTRDITSSEALIYVNCPSEHQLDSLRRHVLTWLPRHFPEATVEFQNSGNLYDIIFTSDESYLELRVQTAAGGRPSVGTCRNLIDTLRLNFPGIDIQPVATEQCVIYRADMERLALHKVSFRQLSQRLTELIADNKVYSINSGAQSIPVLLGRTNQDCNALLSATLLNEEGTEVPLRLLLDTAVGEDFKRLHAGDNGSYYPISIECTSHEAERIMEFTDALQSRHLGLNISYAGEYFSSRALINELAIVLAVSLLLLYFVLAAQFESLLQPLLILSEMAVDVCVVLLFLWLLGESINVMSMIGIIVMGGIVINDSILKIDTINRHRRAGLPLTRAIYEAGRQRLRPIIMTSLTTILAILPLLRRGSIGGDLQFPLSLTLVIGMAVGTLVSLFIVPTLYYIIYRTRPH